MSIAKTDRSRWSSPWRSATARARPSWLMAPWSSSTCSGVVPVARAASTACSTRWRSTSPRSTMTSVRKRAAPPPERRGGVTPFQSGGWPFWAAGAAVAAGTAGAATAAGASGTATPSGGGAGLRGTVLFGVMAIGGGSTSALPHGLHGRREAGPGLEAQGSLTDEHLQPVDHRAPPLSCPRDERGAAGPVDQVHHGRVSVQRIGTHRQGLELAVAEPDTRAVNQQIGRDRPINRLD